jgi:hypothetical protein
VTASTSTEVGGKYSFSDLPQGTYTVSETEQAGWVKTTSPDPERTIVVGSVFGDVDIGNFEFGTIKGFKFNDENGNGTREVGEPKLPGWTIVLHRPSSTTTEVVTDSNGNYEFTDVGPGEHTVHEVQQAGWQQTSPDPAPITLESGKTSSQNNFGNQEL